MTSMFFSDDEEQGSQSDFGDPGSVSSPLFFPGSEAGADEYGSSDGVGQLSILALLVAALRKSLGTCTMVAEEDAAGSPDIGWPTDVRHVAHVTFDQFDGFLGLPSELERDVPGRDPSASASIFGVSATSMRCSYDPRGNCVPTILLLMQRHLYSAGGLQAEGIFRINAENGHDVYVREQLNTGVVPHGIDVHCLAGLIKAWFRELPRGVLDCITPDQMIHCNSEEECSQLVIMLPPTEAALLDWAINLMADVVEHEHHNKMNARNIAMVFAPNMTQMADPLTALIHAVQVMNFLKTLIMKTLREREEAAADDRMFESCSESPNDTDELCSLKPTEVVAQNNHPRALNGSMDVSVKPLFINKHDFKSDVGDNFWRLEMKSETEDSHQLNSGRCSPTHENVKVLEDEPKPNSGNGDMEGLRGRLNFRRNVRKLCRHPVFLFCKTRNQETLALQNNGIKGR